MGDSMNSRDEIESAVQRAISIPTGEYDGYLAHDTADSIINLIRKSLLSDASVMDAIKRMNEVRVIEPGRMNSSAHIMRETISAAIDTAFNAGFTVWEDWSIRR